LGKVNRSGVIIEGKSRDLFIKRFGKPIEDFESYKIATESLAPKTSATYLKVLPNYFLYLDQDPDSVIAQRKRDLYSDDSCEFYERKTTMYIRILSGKEKGNAGFYLSSQLGRIQGFFTNNGKRLSLDLGKLKISKARKHRKYSPSNEEVRLLIGKADCARDRLIVALMFQNGPAPIDVSLLCCEDYPLEPWVYFERSRSKTGEVWRGVSTPDVCEYLKAYLTVRGVSASDKPLFVGRFGPLDSEGISEIVHNLIVSIPELSKIEGLKPTSLRDAFEDALVDAETYHKVKEALMAHSSGIEKEYGGHKQMVSKLTEAMKKVYPLLCLNDLNRVSGEVAGFSPQELEKLKAVLGRYDEVMTIADLVKNGKLMHIDDPLLVQKLKSQGKIK
jgi:integrase